MKAATKSRAGYTSRSSSSYSVGASMVRRLVLATILLMLLLLLATV